MSSSKYISNKLITEVNQYGRGLVSVKYPNEIEVYLCALELTNSKNETQKYFMFPIMPSSISKTENNRTNIKKSSSGTVVLMSGSYTPSEISIKGDFGRSFKFITNPTGDRFSYALFNTKGKDRLNINSPEFDPSVKSGYGCIKILQSMINETNKLDEYSKPNRLYFYNLALGESYLVAILPGGLTLSQNYEKNMIWQYSLSMQALCNIEDMKSSEEVTKSSKSLLSSKLIQNSVNVIVSEVKGLL